MNAKKVLSDTNNWKLSVLTEIEGLSLKAIGSADYESEASAQTALAALRNQSQLTVESVVRKVAGTPPPLLYDLTALQKDTNRCHGFSADKTLSIAQSLYEKKITTYPRTGSRYISEDVFEEVPVLLRKIGMPLSNPLNRHSVDNTKVTDHHAIIPTGETPSGLSADETTIYQMVVNRFIDAFSPDSEEERMQVRFTYELPTYHRLVLVHPLDETLLCGIPCPFLLGDKRSERGENHVGKDLDGAFLRLCLFLSQLVAIGIAHR